MTEVIFPKGIKFSNPHPKAPDFVKGKISVKVDEFSVWSASNQTNGWVNLDLKVAKNGTLYLALDTWKPNTTVTPEQAREQVETATERFDFKKHTEPEQTQEEINVDQIPF